MEGFYCNRDVNANGKHPGRHYMPDKGYWGQEFRDLEAPSAPRAQFCDLDWQDRFVANPEAPAFWMDYDVVRDKLFTTGPLGSVYMTSAQVKPFVDRVRQWADSVESYMKDYKDDEGKV